MKPFYFIFLITLICIYSLSDKNEAKAEIIKDSIHTVGNWLVSADKQSDTTLCSLRSAYDNGLVVEFFKRIDNKLIFIAQMNGWKLTQDSSAIGRFSFDKEQWHNVEVKATGNSFFTVDLSSSEKIQQYLKKKRYLKISVPEWGIGFSLTLGVNNNAFTALDRCLATFNTAQSERGRNRTLGLGSGQKAREFLVLFLNNLKIDHHEIQPPGKDAVYWKPTAQTVAGTQLFHNHTGPEASILNWKVSHLSENCPGRFLSKKHPPIKTSKYRVHSVYVECKDEVKTDRSYYLAAFNDQKEFALFIFKGFLQKQFQKILAHIQTKEVATSTSE